MPKEEQNCAPDIKKGMDDAKNIKDRNKGFKDDADRRQRDGCNLGDVTNNSDKKK